jgi:hypothetical protein
MPKQAAFCRHVTLIAEDYLGPSGPRFIERLSNNHLGKPSEQITPKDMDELIKWARLAAAMLTDDAGTITEFMDRLDKLSSKRVAHDIKNKNS